MKNPYQFIVQWMTALIVAIAAVAFSAQAYAATNMNSAIGYWKTVDDKSGQILSVVEIYPGGDSLHGKIVKIYPVLGQKTTDICVKCRGDAQNKPMLGLQILWGMVPVSANTWAKGRVLDPKSGSIYSGSMKLIDNGEKLRLRGFIGISMFGRSETWIRTERP